MIELADCNKSCNINIEIIDNGYIVSLNVCNDAEFHGVIRHFFPTKESLVEGIKQVLDLEQLNEMFRMC